MENIDNTIPLKVLIIEDSVQDLERILHELKLANFSPDYLRIENINQLDSALQEKNWDLVLSNYDMPHLFGMEALQYVIAQNQDLPFIMLSNVSGEDTAVEVMRLGASDYMKKNNLKRLGASINRELNEAEFRKRNQAVKKDILQSEYRLLYLSQHDSLTQLANRSAIETLLKREIVHAEKRGRFLAVLCIDLDHFKKINDAMGSHFGDELLKHVAIRFNHILRPRDIIGRIGGDEFIVILPDIHSTDDVVAAADRMRHQFEQPFKHKDKEFIITLSIGVSLYPKNGKDVETLIKNADIAMYQAKEQGRNNFQFCTQALSDHIESRARLGTSLRHALSKNEFIIYYQPKVSLSDNQIVGMETLVRWRRPIGLFYPKDFISLAEDTGLIVPISEWIFMETANQLKSWMRQGLPPITLSINLSVRTINWQLVDHFVEFLKEIQLPASSIELEITESFLMRNLEANAEIVNSLKQLGFKISIDDFGTGYSSLAYLKKLGVDYLKIDQSFIHEIMIDPSNEAIISAIIVMSHHLGIKVIAEGVENREQCDFLRRLACDEAQGYYFSLPVTVEEAELLLKQGKIVPPNTCK